MLKKIGYYFNALFFVYLERTKECFMKKLFLITLFFSIIFSSCTNTSDIKEDNVVKFEYEGHDYIRFEYGYGSNRTFSVVHDPDCECKDPDYDDDDDDYECPDEDDDNVEHD